MGERRVTDDSQGLGPEQKKGTGFTVMGEYVAGARLGWKISLVLDMLSLR